MSGLGDSMLEQAQEENKSPSKRNRESDQAPSETSEQLLAQLREQFKKKEATYKHRIQQLSAKINKANESCREKATELSSAYANTMSEYAHLETAQREQLMKKDLQIKLLKDRISLL